MNINGSCDITVRNRKNAYDVYAETLQVDGLGFKYKNQIKDHFWYFKEKLEGQRFDVAYGIQKGVKLLLLSKWYQRDRYRNIVMSGGVAQNIKANKLIAELDGVNQVFIPPDRVMSQYL